MSFIHLYENGAFNRRELISRLTQYTGTAAAVIAAVESAGLAEAQTTGCLAGVQVTENDPAVISQTVVNLRPFRRFIRVSIGTGRLRADSTAGGAGGSLEARPDEAYKCDAARRQSRIHRRRS